MMIHFKITPLWPLSTPPIGSLMFSHSSGSMSLKEWVSNVCLIWLFFSKICGWVQSGYGLFALVGSWRIIFVTCQRRRGWQRDRPAWHTICMFMRVKAIHVLSSEHLEPSTSFEIELWNQKVLAAFSCLTLGFKMQIQLNDEPKSAGLASAPTKVGEIPFCQASLLVNGTFLLHGKCNSQGWWPGHHEKHFLLYFKDWTLLLHEARPWRHAGTECCCLPAVWDWEKGVPPIWGQLSIPAPAQKFWFIYHSLGPAYVLWRQWRYPNRDFILMTVSYQEI